MPPRTMLWAIVVAATFVALRAATCDAEQAAIIKMERVLTVDERGDAQVRFSVRFPAAVVYSRAKANFQQNLGGNMAALLRRLGNGHHWALMSDVVGEFDDNHKSLVITYRHHGVARAEADDRWRIDFEEDADLDVLLGEGRILIFSAIETTDFDLSQLVVKIELPKNAIDGRYSSKPGRLTYRLTSPPESDAGKLAVDYELDCKPQIMSALAKSYALNKFPHLWTARTIFRNTGERTVTDFRVRCRLANLSSWSPWEKVARVVPGATVVSPFYPVLDFDKVRELTGSRPVSLEMELEYRRPDGTLVAETDTSNLELLGRNDVILSSMDLDEGVSYYDWFDNSPVICASFVTSKDPVMQQFAGAVAQTIGRAATTYNDEDAVKFLAGIQNFLAVNKITYQSPPGLLHQSHLRQHVKFGRDVLRNRAGTCIDLAILYASACEAVGLQTYLVMVPGHCFMGVYLPSGKRVPVETTVLGQRQFQQALEAGAKQMEKAEQGPSFIVEVNDMRRLGVLPLDLPKASDNYIRELGFKLETPDFGGGGEDQPAQQPARPATPPSIVGNWAFQGNVRGIQMTMAVVMQKDGRFAGYVRVTQQDGSYQEVQDSGTYRVDGDTLVVTDPNGQTLRRTFRLEKDTAHVHYQELNTTIPFRRVLIL